jgi:RHS repeat-associated protein
VAGNNARGLTQNLLPKEIWVAPTGGILEKRVEFTQYDTYGNPTEYKVDNMPTALIWGYDNTLLLAQIQNVSASQVATKLASVGIIASDFSVTNLSNTQLTSLETFRNSLPKSTLVSWFSHIPTIGLSSTISPNGLRNSFIYDAFQRLFYTKDHADFITSKYLYEYGFPYNKITTIIPITPTTDPNTLTGFSYFNSINNFSYSDGLNRNLQTIGLSLSPTKKSIVSGVPNYDKYGRVTGTIIPTSTNNYLSDFEPNALTKAKVFYGDNAPKDSTVYENSPLNRVIATFGVGNAWRVANKRNQVFYESAGEDVRYYTVDATGNITKNGTYPAQSLFKKRVISEQGNTSIEITDKRGRLVQSQVEQSSGEYLTTYFIYDASGRELAVIQPQGYELDASISASSVEWNNFVFFYKYDARGRNIESHIPNKGIDFSVFDKQDRQVLSQNEYQRTTNKWSFMKYDSLSRNIISGELINSNSRILLQNQFDTQSIINEGFDANLPTKWHYSDVSFPFSVDSSNAMTVNYFDNYDTWRPTGFDFLTVIDSNLPYTNAKSLMTGNYKRNTENRKMLLEVNYFDYKNRTQQIRKQNQFNGIAYLSYKYNFANDITIAERNFNPFLIRPQKQYSYDNARRKTQYVFGFLGSPQQPQIRMASFDFDEIGRLKIKKIQPYSTYQINDTGADYINRPPTLEQANTQDIANKAIILSAGFVADSTTQTYLAQIDTLGNSGTVDALQTIDYEYNIRGGINCINCKNKTTRLGNKQNDLFSMKLDYNEDQRYYDGNISKQTWKTPTIPNAQQYKYSYDRSSRLKKAQYLGGISGSNYSIDTLNYDQNGNILKLKRHAIDDLSYIYDGNKLLSVSDAGTTAGFSDGNTSGNDYGYWNDGSLKYDKNKGIDSVFYNSYLRKVSRVKFNSGSWINFFYDGAGTLLKRKLSNNDVWTYTDELITKNDLVYQLSHDEGRVTYNYTTNKWVYEYDYRDHQGNLRLSFRDSLVVGKPPVVTQIEDRDPTGVSLAGLNYANQNKSNFGFINRETIVETGWIDLNNRFFDPFINRFHQIDLIIKGQENYSLYQYGYNNPVMNSDPNGTCPIEPCSQNIAKSDATRVSVSPISNVPNTGSISPSFSLTVSEGSQFGVGASIGKTSIGAEVNFGSREVFKMTDYGLSSNPTTNGIQNNTAVDGSTSKGFNVSVGAVSVSAEQKTKNETVLANLTGTSIMLPTTKTTTVNQSSVGFGIKGTPLSVSADKTKTTTTLLGQTSVQYSNPSINVGGSRMTGASKNVQGIGISVSAYYKIEAKFDPIQAVKNYFNSK